MLEIHVKFKIKMEYLHLINDYRTRFFKIDPETSSLLMNQIHFSSRLRTKEIF